MAVLGWKVQVYSYFSKTFIMLHSYNLDVIFLSSSRHVCAESLVEETCKFWNVDNNGLGWRSRYSDLLRAERYENRISVGQRFSATIQTGSGAHPASCTMGIGRLSQG